MRRLVITLVAVAGLLAGPLAPAMPAPARGEPQVRNLHDEMVKKRGKIFFQGRVDPGHGPVVVQKKACSAPKCPWKKYRVVKTHGDQNRWKVRVYAPRHGSWYWRGYVEARGGYDRSWTGKWRTYVS